MITTPQAVRGVRIPALWGCGQHVSQGARGNPSPAFPQELMAKPLLPPEHKHHRKVYESSGTVLEWD